MDASGGVVIAYPDKTTETITNPLVATLVATGSGTGTTGTTPNNAYTIADLGLATVPLALNNAGQILTRDSTEFFGGTDTLYRSSYTAAPQPLPGLNGATAIASSLNDSGEIVGGDGYFTGSSSSSGSSYDWANPSATPVIFRPADLSTDVVVARINNKREAVGKGALGDGSFEAFYWKDASVAPTVLPGQTLQVFSGNSYFATDISQDGRIVGVGKGKPLYWQNATTQPVPLAYSGTDTFVTLRVNSKGNIVARVDTGSVSHILFWTSPQAQPQTLPGLAGSTSEQANCMNENGDIVGNSVTGHGSTAVIWKAGVPQDLNKVATSAFNGNGDWSYVTATAINDKGWILGTGPHLVNNAISSQYLSAYLLIPK